MRLQLVFRQIDVIHQLPQPPLITPAEAECQARQMAELCFMFLSLISVLLKVLSQAQIGEGPLHMLNGFVGKGTMHANDEFVLEPAA